MKNLVRGMSVFYFFVLFYFVSEGDFFLIFCIVSVFIDRINNYLVSVIKSGNRKVENSCFIIRINEC